MAASKVNVKFVVVLGAVLLLVFGGVAGAFLFIKLKSGDRYARMGDAALAKGSIDEADRWYARAVGKDQSRVDWLVKWRDTRRKKVPKTQSEYQEDYQMYLSLLRTLATAKRNDVAAHRDFLEELYQQGIAVANFEGHWKGIITETEASMRYFEPEKPAGLRRYRGISYMALLSLPVPPTVTEDQIAMAREDLEAGLKADPKDEAVLNSLCGWHRMEAKRLKELGKTEDAAAERAASNKVVDDLLAADPSSAFGKVQRLLLYAADTELMEDGRRSAQEQAKARTAALEALRPRVTALTEDLKKTDPKQLTLPVVGRFVQLALQLDPKDGAREALEVTERALEGSKDSPDLMWLRTHMTMMSGDPEKGLEQYQAIIDLPSRPVSLEGMRLIDLRTRAMFLQTTTCLSQAVRQQTTPEARAAMLERAEKYREQLARNVPEHSPEMLLIDGKTRFIKGDFRGAQQALAEFVRAPGMAADQAFDAYVYLADIATRNGELGLAQDCIEKLVELRPGAVEPMMMLAEAYMRTQRTADALKTYERVLEVDPSNEKANKNVGVLRALANPKGATLEDPVLQALVETQRLIMGTTESLGDEQKGMDRLEEAIAKLGPDPRLVIALAQIKATRADADGAIKTLEMGLAAHPDDASIKSYMSQVKASATLPGMLELIEASQGSPADKAWLRYRAYANFGKKTEADAAMEELARLAPTDPRALEARFNRAIASKDLAKAQELADQAAKTNADSMDGDTFRVRMLIAKGDLAGLTAVLQRIAERGNANVGQLRLLGVALLQMGRQEDGLAMLRRALDLNPGDVLTVKAMVQSLERLDRPAEALAVARDSAVVAQRDPDFLNVWLALEAQAGKRDFAVQRREQVWARNKADLANGAALADLYMDGREWDKAKGLIDELRKDKEANVRLAGLAARWHADQQNLEPARQVFVELIAAVQAATKEGSPSPEAYMAFGQFMLRYGRYDVGLAALRQAERLQDAATMPVTIAMGDSLLGLARWADAEAAFRRVLEAKVPDPQNYVRKRLIETLVQQRKLDEADKEFLALGAAAEDDVELMCQRSYAVRLRGDTRKAREILDQAISKFPREPVPYMRRARILMLNPATVKDALADLDTAVNIRKGMWQAYRTRAQLLLDSGRIEEGLKDLEAAALANPSLDGLRLEQIDELLRRRRESDAVDAAEAALKARPNDVRLMRGIAERFAAAGSWARAQRFYKDLWLVLQDAPSAEAYVDALLSSTPPGFAEALAVLATPKLAVERSVPLLMTRARVAKRQGKEEQARADTMAAFSLALADTSQLGAWVTRLRQVFPVASQSLAALKAVRVPPALSDWLSLQQGIVMIDDPPSREEGFKVLRAILDGKGDKVYRTEAVRALSAAYANDKSWEPALAVTRTGLELAADDVMFNNNAAYFLCEGLGKAGEALPLAQKAATLAPQNAQVLDTLADVHWRSGNKADAIRVLTEALRLAQNETDKANWALKLGRWQLESGDKTGAMGQVNMVRELLTDAPRLVDTHKSKVDELEKDIQAAK